MDTEEPEQVERIPWAELLPHPGTSRPWITYAVIGAIALGAIVLATTRRQVVAPTVTLATSVSGQTLATSAPLPVPEVEATAASLYTEADLMAVAPQTAPGWIAGRAEWFVRDYFTATGEDDEWSRVLLHVPEGAIRQRGRPPRGSSYVEWTQAIGISEPAPGDFEVLVAFQLLVPEGDSFRRLDVRAVTVALTTDREGTAAVRDLPSPSQLRYGFSAPAWGREAEPPDDIASSVLTEAAGWGGDPKILAASHSAEGWRFVVAVSDEAGNEWPLVVLRDG